MDFFRKYLLPGFVFQSVTIGGGYGTGRELVEFFLSEGPAGGYAGMLVSAMIWGVIMALSFELARMTRAYNYRTFLQGLLGHGWWLYEFLYLSIVLLVLSVMGSAASELMSDMFGIPHWMGTTLMLAVTAVFIFYGNKIIERALALWSFALYGAYLVLIIAALYVFGDIILATMGEGREGSEWFVGGLKYAGYNISTVPALLFASRYITSRKEAIWSGLIAGWIGIIPAILFYTAMLGHYPVILSETVPANFLLDKLNMPLLKWVFQIVLLGTFVETGIGFVHGYNERVAGVYEEKGKIMPRKLRVFIGGGILIVALYISNSLGLVSLIADGYGTITWGFWLVFILPVLTLGVWKIWKWKSVGG